MFVVFKHIECIVIKRFSAFGNSEVRGGLAVDFDGDFLSSLELWWKVNNLKT